jgi:hypothetical protein
MVPLYSLLAVGVAAALVAAPAAVQGARPADFQAVLDCRAIAEPAQRLACYDTAAGRMATAEKAGDIMVIDRQQAREAHRQAFGLNLPSLDILTRGMTGDETDRLEGVVRTAQNDGHGKWTLVLEDGAVWRQISDETLNRAPRRGSKVSIRRAALGSYKMNIDNQPAVRVHRDQ